VAPNGILVFVLLPRWVLLPLPLQLVLLYKAPRSRSTDLQGGGRHQPVAMALLAHQRLAVLAETPVS
jgi:hypothetical protein